MSGSDRTAAWPPCEAAKNYLPVYDHSSDSLDEHSMQPTPPLDVRLDRWDVEISSARSFLSLPFALTFLKLECAISSDESPSAVEAELVVPPPQWPPQFLEHKLPPRTQLAQKRARTMYSHSLKAEQARTFAELKARAAKLASLQSTFALVFPLFHPLHVIVQ